MQKFILYIFHLTSSPYMSNLWGHDILQGLRAYLTNLKPLVTHQILQQYFLRTLGLGKNNQGRRELLPIILKKNNHLWECFYLFSQPNICLIGSFGSLRTLYNGYICIMVHVKPLFPFRILWQIWSIVDGHALFRFL